jgi:2-polyprenyl-6-methoxyphenol hydroxylase-like FAD-dependent oxidoreductase
MHAAICGAGLDALTLALQLGRGGWAVSILESRPPHSRDGYLIELAGEGLAAAEQLGILPALLESAEWLPEVRWVDARGKSIAHVHVTERHDGSLDDSVHVLHEDIERILLETLPSNVVMHTGVFPLRARMHANSVELTLSSDERLDVDLLIGADGRDSHVRRLIFGDAGLWSRYLGYHSASLVFEDASVHGDLAGHRAVLSAPGRLVALCPLHDSKVAATLMYRTSSTVRPKSPAEWLQFVFGDMQWCVPTVLAHAKRATDLRYDHAIQIKSSTWHRARVGLLGDACHAYSLLPGQECSAAIAAAHWLGNELVRGASFETAFNWYQSYLAQAVASQRSSGPRLAHWLMPDSRTNLVVRNSLLRMARLPAIGRFVRPTVSLTT